MKSDQNIRIGVVGAPVRRKNGQLEFLLSERHQPQNPLWHHKWQLIGGSMEWGETPEQTLAREFEEEIQASCQIIWPHPIAKTSTWQAKDNETGQDSHILLLTYIVDIAEQIPDCSGDEETKEAKWYSLPEAMKLEVLPNLKEFLLEIEKVVIKEKLI